jgi:hypothetical protein
VEYPVWHVADVLEAIELACDEAYFRMGGVFSNMG